MSFQRFSEPTALGKRRALEEERSARILDEKKRVQGIDVSVLDKQVAEKKRIQEFEKERDQLYQARLLQMDKTAVEVQKEINALRHEKLKELNTYRQMHQTKEQSREWDLNDKRAISKELPTRLGDHDPRLGASSIQKFVGEDVDYLARRKNQVSQYQMFCSQMVEEKDMRKWQEKEVDREYEERVEQTTRRGYEIEQDIAQKRRMQAIETAQFNRAMEEQKKKQTHLERYREQQRDMNEIQQALDSDLLTENKNVTLNSNDPNRFKPDHMKGFLPAQRQAIMDEQARGREELQARREREKAEERAAQEQMEQIRRQGLLLDRQKAREQREAAWQVSQERKQQAGEAAERTNHLTNLYSNDVGDYFHDRFGASLR